MHCSIIIPRNDAITFPDNVGNCDTLKGRKMKPLELTTNLIASGFDR